MHRSNLIVVLALAAPFARGQSADAYVKLRVKQHIVQPTSSEALDALLGTKIVEIQGVVQGSFTSGTLTSLMVQRDDGQTQIVDCTEAPPAWLGNGEVQARLLVRVTRNAEYDPLTAEMIAAAPEQIVKRIDDAYWKKEAKQASDRQRPASFASRGGGDLHGWIGRPPRGHRDVELPVSSVTPIYADFVMHRNPQLTPDKAMEIARAVVGFSIKYGVDARLVMAVLMVESDFRPGAISRTGAMGLGQLMPGTAAYMGVQDAWDCTDNLDGAVRLLRGHLDRYRAETGDDDRAVQLALAAYNAGEGAVKKYGGIPPYRETQNYVAKVIDIYNKLARE